MGAYGEQRLVGGAVGFGQRATGGQAATRRRVVFAFGGQRGPVRGEPAGRQGLRVRVAGFIEHVGGGPCSTSGMRRVRYAPEGSILLTRCAENAIIGVERTPGGCTLEGASAESPLSIQSGQRDPLERGPFPVN